MKSPHKFIVDKKLLIQYCLRISLAVGFLSAVFDRLGGWPKHLSVWGDWDAFVTYTQILNPWFPDFFIPWVAILATLLEVIFSICLVLGYKLIHIATASGILLLIFALAMSINTGLKGALDYSVFVASAAAFSLHVFLKESKTN